MSSLQQRQKDSASIHGYTKDACGCVRSASLVVVNACSTHKPWRRFEFLVDQQAPGACVLRVRLGSQNDSYMEFEAFRAEWMLQVDVNDGAYNRTEPYVYGFLKWDGCMNPDIMASSHFCGREEAVRLGMLLGFIYDVGHGLLPTADWDPPKKAHT